MEPMDNLQELESMKSEANALFHQQKFYEAVSIFTSIILQLNENRIAHATAETNDKTQQLEIAVRLNRALSCIELHDRTKDDDKKLLLTAEADCTIVLRKNSQCVKALYRRALARERMGNTQKAKKDADEVMKLEPSNPSLRDLLARLQTHQASDNQHEAVVEEMRQCSLTFNTMDKQSKQAPFSPHEDAEQAWRALQDEEASLRKNYRPNIHRSKRTKVSPNRSSRQEWQTQRRIPEGEISKRTGDLWESLTREEEATIAKIYEKVPSKQKHGAP